MDINLFNFDMPQINQSLFERSPAQMNHDELHQAIGQLCQHLLHGKSRQVKQKGTLSYSIYHIYLDSDLYWDMGDTQKLRDNLHFLMEAAGY